MSRISPAHCSTRLLGWRICVSHSLLDVIGLAVIGCFDRGPEWTFGPGMVGDDVRFSFAAYVEGERSTLVVTTSYY